MTWFVIASEAKQSILPHEERMDCFVASLLAMTVDSVAAYKAVILRESGGSSTPRLLGSIISVSGILGRPPSRTMTPNMGLPSRDALRPRLA
jgi:hypothetical protein